MTELAGLLVVGVEERTAGESRVRITELTLELEPHVAAVAQPEQVQPGLDAVDEQAAVEILEPCAGSDRPREQCASVLVAQLRAAVP